MDSRTLRSPIQIFEELHFAFAKLRGGEKSHSDAQLQNQRPKGPKRKSGGPFPLIWALVDV